MGVGFSFTAGSNEEHQSEGARRRHLWRMTIRVQWRRQKARKTSFAECNSLPLLKAGNVWWQVANVEQSQKSTQCSNQPGQLSFWHSLTWFLWSKALYVMHRWVIHLNTAVPEPGAVYGDPAYGETYQMLHLSAQSNLTKWYEKEDHYCFAMRSIFNEANGSRRGAVGR